MYAKIVILVAALACQAYAGPRPRAFRYYNSDTGSDMYGLEHQYNGDELAAHLQDEAEHLAAQGEHYSEDFFSSPQAPSGYQTAGYFYDLSQPEYQVPGVSQLLPIRNQARGYFY